VNLDMMGQEMDFDQILTIADSGATWKIIEETKMPMGEMIDKITLSKTNLSPIKRMVDQGPVVIELNYEEKEINGRMNMSGEKTPVSITTTGFCKAEGPGAFFVIATLPLADGYKTVLRNVDLTTMSEKFYALEVVGTESIKNKSCYKLRMAPANGDAGEIFIWITKDDHPMPLKYEMTLPEMNGAVMRAELK